MSMEFQGKINYPDILDFYNGKKVFVTGNTGFKGSWLTHILLSAGAKVIGYSLQPSANLSLFHLLGLKQRKNLKQHYADVRDFRMLKQVFITEQPDIVFHLAAQPIVRESYRNPLETYSVNVMGAVNLCETLRVAADCDCKHVVRSFLNVTTDKVYRNNEWSWGYRETDFLDGFDPYSNSKSCSELVTRCYKDVFFHDILDDLRKEPLIRVSIARAGNVIGGGDFSNDRIIPDCVKAIMNARSLDRENGVISIRNPYSIRPYEHVLEPLFAYMMIAKSQYENYCYGDCYNVGPEDVDCISTGSLVKLFADNWNESIKESVLPKLTKEIKREEEAFHEATFLKLDCSKLKSTFGWKPRWHIEDAVRQTINWVRVWMSGGDIREEMDREIDLFIS